MGLIVNDNNLDITKNINFLKKSNITLLFYPILSVSITFLIYQVFSYNKYYVIFSIKCLYCVTLLIKTK